MLFLVFRIGDEGYALAGEHIIEVLPLIEATRIRGAPAEVAGLINYRGSFVPVVDLCQLELGRPCDRRMGTRTVLVHVPVGERTERLGLIVEHATDTLRCDPGDFTPFVQGPQGLVQQVEPVALLPAHLRDMLFAGAAA